MGFSGLSNIVDQRLHLYNVFFDSPSIQRKQSAGFNFRLLYPDSVKQKVIKRLLSLHT